MSKTSPNKKGIKMIIRDEFDDFHRNAVRKHVHSFWFKREIPKINNIYQLVSNDDGLPKISRACLHRLLKIMDLTYSKRSRNSAMTEKDEIVVWRCKYLKNILKYREEGRQLYYLDETWVNVGECSGKTWIDNTIKSHRDTFLKGLTTGSVNPTSKGKRLIILHIGSEDGFVPGGLLC